MDLQAGSLRLATTPVTSRSSSAASPGVPVVLSSATPDVATAWRASWASSARSAYPRATVAPQALARPGPHPCPRSR